MATKGPGKDPRGRYRRLTDIIVQVVKAKNNFDGEEKELGNSKTDTQTNILIVQTLKKGGVRMMGQDRLFEKPGFKTLMRSYVSLKNGQRAWYQGHSHASHRGKTGVKAVDALKT
jgi:hypothetical protein